MSALALFVIVVVPSSTQCGTALASIVYVFASQKGEAIFPPTYWPPDGQDSCLLI